MASVGDVVTRIAGLGRHNDVLDALKRNSNEAGRRFEQARHLFESRLVISFFEGEEYGRMGIVSLQDLLQRQGLHYTDRRESICNPQPSRLARDAGSNAGEP